MDAVIIALAAQLRVATPITVDLRQTECLADAVYHEARGEPLAAQIAVASVVLNRGEPCTVIREPHQFSYRRKRDKRHLDMAAWRQSAEVALLTQSGAVQRYEVNHFHDTSVQPWWASKMEFRGQAGRMKFYDKAPR